MRERGLPLDTAARATVFEISDLGLLDLLLAPAALAALESEGEVAIDAPPIFPDVEHQSDEMRPSSIRIAPTANQASAPQSPNADLAQRSRLARQLRRIVNRGG